MSEYLNARADGCTRKRALLIAVSDYDFFDALDFCRYDGEEMSAVLANLGYEISGKLIGYVEWHTMHDAILDFFTQNVKLGDTLLLYYSGHGIPDIDGGAYITSSQTNRDMPEKRSVSLDDLTRSIQRSISGRIVILLDCCYSGSARISKTDSNDATLLRTSISKIASTTHEGEGRCLLAACQGLEEAYALEEQNHSLFTYYLLQGLRGNKSSVDDRGYVTADSLGKYIYNSIMSLPSERRPRQRPIKKVEASGDIILGYFPNLAKTERIEGNEITAKELNNKELTELLKEGPTYRFTQIDKIQDLLYWSQESIKETKNKRARIQTPYGYMEKD